MKSSIACFLFYATWMILFHGAQLTKTENKYEDILDKVKAGLQYANNYIETAKDIADLVSKSLSHQPKQKQKGEKGKDGNDKIRQPFGPLNLVSAFFRLIRLDSPKVAVIAINSVIFLAQMISSLFGLKSPQNKTSRNTNDEGLTWDPLKFILENNNERVRDLVNQARDINLSNQLIERMSSPDSACIRLLLCKSSPIVKAAQNSLNNKLPSGIHRITAWLPPKEEFETNSDECENKHTDCSI